MFEGVLVNPADGAISEYQRGETAAEPEHRFLVDLSDVEVGKLQALQSGNTQMVNLLICQPLADEARSIRSALESQAGEVVQSLECREVERSIRDSERKVL